MNGVCLPMTLGNDGYFESCKDLQKQIKANIINLLLTMKGERLHQPEFGCDVHKYIFEPMNSNTVEKCRAAISNALARWIPYVEVLKIVLNNTQEDTDSNKLKFYVEYRILQNGSVDAFILNTSASDRRRGNLSGDALGYYDTPFNDKNPALASEAPLSRQQIWKDNPVMGSLLPDGRIPRPDIDNRRRPVEFITK